ncbi:MAG: hypothetical protein ABIW38_12520 [Ferruginibacter sp.]
MKKIFLLAGLITLLVSTKGQPLIQGSLRPGSTSDAAMIVLKSNTTYSSSMSNLQFTLQIPTSVGAQPTVTIKSNPLVAYMPSYVTQLTSTEGAYYTYVFAGTNVSGATYNFVSGTEFNALELQFTGGFSNALLRLSNVANGGSNGQAYFYIETNADVTNQAAMFYGSGAVNGGGYGVYSYVPLGIALPVNWLDFSAIRQNNDVVLRWSVAQEINNDHYEIERSTDGINFYPIGLQPSTGSVLVKTYDKLDLNIKSLNSDIIYYRIKQVDIDGKFSYSPTRAVKLTKGEISVYPNPARLGFTVSIPFLTLSDKNVLLKLENAAGQLVEQRTITIAQASNYYFGFSGAKVLSGNYTLKIYNENELLAVKKISVSR